MKPDVKNSTALSPFALARRRLARPFRRDERGAVAVEFGLLALPFFAIVAAIMETAFFFLGSQILDSSVDMSVRLLRTGQAQTQNFTGDDFRTAICDGLYNLFDCSKLKIEVKTIANFAAASFSMPIDPVDMDWTDDFTGTMVFTPGDGSQIVSVRVYYKWPTMIDFFGFNLSNAGEGYRMMAAVRVFRNEPF